jgi:hypothetical protein
LDRLREMALARYSAKNYRGTLISIRKYEKRLMQYESQRWITSTLCRLDSDCTLGVVDMENCKDEIQNIFNHRAVENDESSYIYRLSDDDLLAAMKSEQFDINLIQSNESIK